jgi:hypothetical protein
MIDASYFIINTLLQRGVLRGAETQNRFNGFYALSKTAEAVRTIPPHSYTPLKRGVNKKNAFRVARYETSGVGSMPLV